MAILETARAVLVQAQASLRQLMEEGIRDHRFGEVAEIAQLAERLSRVLVDESGWTTAHESPPSFLPPQSEASSRQLGPLRRRDTSSKTKAKQEYPRFQREGDKLVKVGWSKKHRDEYEHRASRETVVAVARHIANHVKTGQVFEVESLMPVPDATGAEVPAYQVYLTLAWLRSAGAVEKKGRDGHILRNTVLGSTGLAKLWDGVPVKAI